MVTASLLDLGTIAPTDHGHVAVACGRPGRPGGCHDIRHAFQVGQARVAQVAIDLAHGVTFRWQAVGKRPGQDVGRVVIQIDVHPGTSVVGVGVVAMAACGELPGNRVVGDAMLVAVVDGRLQDWSFHLGRIVGLKVANVKFPVAGFFTKWVGW